MSKWKFTVIHHQARIKMGLSLNEYCVFDLIYKTQTNPDYSNNGWAENSYTDIKRDLGLSKGTAFNIINRGVERGFLEVNPANPKQKKATRKWHKPAYENDDTNRSENERSENERSENERERSENERQTVQKMNDSVQKMNDKESNKESNKGKLKVSENAREKTEPEKDLSLKANTPSKKVAAKKVSSDFPQDDYELTPLSDIPDWTTVAKEMADFFRGPGLDQWKFQCDAAGGWVNPLVITTMWAGKNCDSPYLLKNWKKHTGKLTNWIKNQLNSDTIQNAKIKKLKNGKQRDSNDPLISADKMEQAYRELLAEGYR